MKHILSVPYYSQLEAIKDPAWNVRSCAIVCLKMVMDFQSETSSQIPSAEHLLQECLCIGGHTSFGWVHAAIARLAHNYGLLAYNEEFRSVKVNCDLNTFSQSDFAHTMIEKGILKFQKTLNGGSPIIVSIAKNWQEENKYHQIVLIGYEEEGGNLKGFYYHEPDRLGEEGKNLFVDLETFKKYWRKFAIFVEK